MSDLGDCGPLLRAALDHVYDTSDELTRSLIREHYAAINDGNREQRLRAVNSLAARLSSQTDPVTVELCEILHLVGDISALRA